MWRSFCYIFDGKDRFRLFLLLLSMLFCSLVELCTLGAVPLYISLVLGGRQAGSLPVCGPWLEEVLGTEVSRLAVRGGALLLLLFLLRTLYMVFTVWLQGRILGNRWLAIGSRFFKRYLGCSYSELCRCNTSRVIENVLVESEKLVTQGVEAGLNFFKDMVIVLTVFALLLYVDPLVSLSACAVLGGIGGLVLLFFNRRMKEWGGREYEARNFSSQAIAEGMGACREATILGCRPYFASRLHRALEGQTLCWRNNSVFQKSLWPIMEYVTLCVLLGTMGILLGHGRSLDSVAPTIVLLTVCLARLKGSLTEGMYYYSRMRGSWSATMTVAGELQRLEAAADKETTGDKLDGDIEVTHLSYRYPGETPNISGRDVLHDVSLHIGKGESVGFVGKTGAGKSTMVDLLLGVLHPQSGAVLVNGKNIEEHLRGWRSRIGFVPQEIFLLDDTIRANVALGEENPDEESLRRALASANILEFVQSLPRGLDTVIGERGVRLSGGQRQRLGIARALYHNPAVLIFDEATSALDNQTESAVVEAIARLRGEHTIITVAHRLTTVRDCNRIFRFDNGSVEAFASLSELMEKKQF